MARRLISAAGTIAVLWFFVMTIIAVIAVTLEGEVSGGALGGIVTVAMVISAMVGIVVRPFARLPRQNRIACRVLFVIGLFGAWLAIGITAWDWNGGNLIAGIVFFVVALLRAAFPPPPPEPDGPGAVPVSSATGPQTGGKRNPP